MLPMTSRLPFVALVAIGVVKYATADVVGRRLRHSTTPTERVLITKYEDISSVLSNSGGSQAAQHFDIEAEDDDDIDSGTLMLHLNTMTPAVTSQTTFNLNQNEEFNQDSLKGLAILASNPGMDGDFTIMSVDKESGDVRGLQRGAKGDTRRISFGNSEGSSAKLAAQRPRLHARTISHSEREFKCGVDHTDDHHDHDHHHHHHHHRVLDETPEEHHNHTELFRSGSSHLRGFKPSAIPEGNPTSNAAEPHHFVINLLIAIDGDFIKRQGGYDPAVEYINFLVSACNVIFEAEINAHLSVVLIEETNIFDNVSELREGLKTIRMHYEGKYGETSARNDIHLVHAFCGKDIGGGIAFIDTVCDSKWGVGLSSGLRGVMHNLDDEAMHDVFMVAHEVGHSLGSGHTFDGYDPPIDTCGVACPPGLPIENSATLMSYCNFCEGGLKNIAPTLGGVYKGVGSRLDVTSWGTSPELAPSSIAISTDPERVSHRIYSSLFAKRQMLNPILAAETPSPTTGHPTANPTASPTTSAPTSNPTKSPTFFPEHPNDGRNWVHPAEHCMQEMNCAASQGVMFDLELAEEPFSHGAVVEAMQFEHIHRNETVELYTTDKTYVGREQLKRKWDKVATVNVDGGNSYTDLVLDTPVFIPPGRKQGFYLVSSSEEAFFLVGKTGLFSSDNETGLNPSSALIDENGVSVNEGSVLFDMYGQNDVGYLPVVQAGYTMAQPPTMQPTTQAPTLSPTVYHGPFSISPESVCDDDCLVAPGFMLDVTNSAQASHEEISITGISFEHLAPVKKRIVHLYRTINGSYSGKEHEPDEWIKIASVKAPKKDYNLEEIVLNTPITLSKDETVGFYLMTEEKILMVGENKAMQGAGRLNKQPSTDGRVKLVCGDVNDGFQAANKGYSWKGAVTYSTQLVLMPWMA